jgi:hypothetical protein
LDYYFLNQILNKKNPPNKTKKRKKLNNNTHINNNSSYKSINQKYTYNKEIILKVKEIMAYNDEEINNLSYKLALKFDKRTYCSYYLSLLKTKHILIFSFINKNDYNSRIIKMDLFFISFSIYMTINALFFNDDSMHKIYENNGSFNIEYQIAQIIYSTLISIILNIPLNLLAISNGSIIKFKHRKYENKNILNESYTSLNKNLKIKF